MGNNYSNNSAMEAVSVMNTVVNSATNNCMRKITQSQAATIQGVSNSVVTLNLDWTQATWVDLKCLATNTFSNDLTNTLTQESNQIAEAVNQQFSLFQFGEATNSIQVTSQLSNTVTNTFVNDCSSVIAQSQQAFILDDNNDVISGTFNWNQTVTDYDTCIFNNSTVTSLQNQLSQSISQSAITKTENYLAGIIAAIVAVIAVVGAVLFGLLGLGLIGGTVLLSSGGAKIAGAAGAASGGANTYHMIRPTTTNTAKFQVPKTLNLGKAATILKV